MHRLPRPFATRALGSPRSRRTVALLTTLALAAGLAGFTGANAATSITPAPAESAANGPVIRNDSLTLNEDLGGRTFVRSNATSNFSAVFPSSLLPGYASFTPPACLGNNTATGGRNLSPRGLIEVLRGTEVIATATAPIRTLGITGPSAPLPATTAPGNNNYLGGPFSTEVSLAGQPAGVYTVKTTVTNMLKTGTFGACVIGTPGTNASGAFTNTFAPGPSVQSWTFEYRPWQQKFTDLLGSGAVQLNTVPKEFQFEVSGAAAPSAIVDAAQSMKLYSLPNSASFSLDIPNPGACGSDPLSCLPQTAVSCNPALGCQPRLATINYQGASDKLTGLFDLETKAFAAVATTGGHTRVLVSGGTEVDELLHDLLDQVTDATGQLGIDLPALLDTDVDLNVKQPDGTTKVIRINLLKGLEMFSVADGPETGLGIAAPVTLGAGVIMHVSTWTGSPDPAFTAPDGTRHSSYGYDVAEASALPAVPSLPGLVAALVPPGKLQHVRSRIPAGSGTHTVLVGADTHADPATGLPVHLPLISTPGANTDDGIDFIGRATVVSLDTCLDILGTPFCLGGGLVLGTGVATFGTSPLPVNFGSIPLIWGDELGLGGVMAPVDGLVNAVLTNPAVQDLVNTVMSSVPALPIPGLPAGTPGGTPGGGIPAVPGIPGLPGIPGVPGGLLGLPGSLPLGSLPLGNLPVGGLLSNLLGIF